MPWALAILSTAATSAVGPRPDHEVGLAGDLLHGEFVVAIVDGLVRVRKGVGPTNDGFERLPYRWRYQ